MTLKLYQNEERNHNQLSELWGLRSFLVKALTRNAYERRFAGSNPASSPPRTNPRSQGPGEGVPEPQTLPAAGGGEDAPRGRPTGFPTPALASMNRAPALCLQWLFNPQEKQGCGTCRCQEPKLHAWH